MNIEQTETLTQEIGQKATEKQTLSEADASSINALHVGNTDTPIDTTDDGQINLDDVQTLSDLERIVATGLKVSEYTCATPDRRGSRPA